MTTSTNAMLEEFESGKIDTDTARSPKTGASHKKAHRFKLQTPIFDTVTKKPPVLPDIPIEGIIEIDPATVRLDTAINQRIHHNKIRLRDKKFIELQASIRIKQTTPILVRPSTTPGYQYDLVFGSQRLNACILNEMTVKAVVQVMGDSEARAVSYSENDVRSQYWPIEEARALMHFMNNESRNVSTHRIEKYESYTKDSRNRLIDFAGLPDELVECCSNPSGLTEHNTRTFRTYYKNHKSAVENRMQELLTKDKHLPTAKLLAYLKDSKVTKRKPTLRYKGDDGKVLLSMRGSDKREGRLQQQITIYGSDSSSLSELIKKLQEIEEIIETSAKTA